VCGVEAELEGMPAWERKTYEKEQKESGRSGRAWCRIWCQCCGRCWSKSALKHNKGLLSDHPRGHGKVCDECRRKCQSESRVRDGLEVLPRSKEKRQKRKLECMLAEPKQSELLY